MIAGKIIVWLIVGALAGTLASRLVTMSKEGYGFWINTGVGILGALVGGALFWLLGINFALGELKVTFEDLLSAFVGALVCIAAYALYRRFTNPKDRAP